MGKSLIIKGADFSVNAINSIAYDISNVTATLNKMLATNGSISDSIGAIVSSPFRVPNHSVIYLKDIVHYKMVVVERFGSQEGSTRYSLPGSSSYLSFSNGSDADDIVIGIQPIEDTDAPALGINSIPELIEVLDGSILTANYNSHEWNWAFAKANTGKAISTGGVPINLANACLFGLIYMPAGTQFSISGNNHYVTVSGMSTPTISGTPAFVQANVTSYTTPSDGYVIFSVKSLDESAVTKGIAKQVLTITMP